MKKYKIYNGIVGLLILNLLFVFNGCKKDFLDAKPSTSIINPTTLSDFQQLIDNVNMNRTSALPQLSCDDYYLVDEAAWKAGQPTERNAYTWAKDVFGGQVARNDWNSPYSSIFYANSVISGLSNMDASTVDRDQYNNIKGQAFFIRAFNYFDLVKNFSLPYDNATSATDLGVPLKLSPNIDEIKQRSTVQQTYDQIISDLQTACSLLNKVVPAQNRNRASKPAGYALFARLYLSMRNYPKAELYADSCLALYNQLIDYNTVDTTSSTPFSKANQENIFWAMASLGYDNSEYDALSNLNVDTLLYNSYKSGDLRKPLYFINDGGLKANKGYSGYYSAFVGLATDEIYLIKSECAVRRQDVQTALTYLNGLLVNRYRKNTYVPYTTSTENAILSLIIQERRKELFWRDGLRWDDLRRLNKEGAAITLTRNLNGKIYTLLPNSPLYVFPIPDDEIALSKIQQNAR